MPPKKKLRALKPKKKVKVKAKRLVRFPKNDEQQNVDDVDNRKPGDKSSSTTFEAGDRKRIDYNSIEDMYLARFVQRCESRGIKFINPELMTNTMDEDVLFVMAGCDGLRTPRERSAIWSHINRHKYKGRNLLKMEINIPDDKTDVSDFNYAKLKNENKKMETEIMVKDKKLQQKCNLIRELNRKVTSSNISFAEHLVKQYGTEEHKTHNLQPIVQLDELELDVEDIERAKEYIKKRQIQEIDEENEISDAESDEIEEVSSLPESPVSHDISSQGERNSGKKKKLLSVLNLQEKASIIQPSVTETTETEVVVPPTEEFLQNSEVGSDKDENRNNISFSSDDTEDFAAVNVDEIVKDTFTDTEDDESRFIFDPAGASASQQKPSGDSECESLVNSQTEAEKFGIDMDITDSDEDNTNSRQPTRKKKKFVLSDLLREKKVKSSGKKKAKTKGRNIETVSPDVQFAKSDDNSKCPKKCFNETDEVVDPMSEENEDVNNNSSEDILGYHDGESEVESDVNQESFLLELAPSQDELFQDDIDQEDELEDHVEPSRVTLPKKSVPKSVGLSEIDMFENNIEDDTPENVQMHSGVKSPKKSVLISPSVAPMRRDNEPVSRNNIYSTQSMRRVPKPTFAPRVYKRRYTRKGQSLRKDQHIKNRFSRELKDKKAEEARKEKNFDNVVSLTPKHYDPKKFQRIPKKTKGDEPVPSTSEKEPVPSTSKEASLQSTSKYSLESTVAGTSSNDTTADSCSS